MIEGALSSLRQLLAPESPLKIMKNVFDFTIKPLLVFKIKEIEVNLKIYDTKTWEENNYETHIVQYLKK